MSEEKWNDKWTTPQADKPNYLRRFRGGACAWNSSGTNSDRQVGNIVPEYYVLRVSQLSQK